MAGNRTLVRRDPAEALAIAKEVDACGDYRKVALLHKISGTTVNGWFMRYKAYGEGDFIKKPYVRRKKESRSQQIQELTDRVSALEILVSSLSRSYAQPGAGMFKLS